MSTRVRLIVGGLLAVGALLVLVVLAATGLSDKHAAPTAAAKSSTTRPVSRPTGPGSSAPRPTTEPPVPTVALPPVTFAPAFTPAQLEQALLQNGDLPLDSRRDVVAPNAWGGVCGSTPPNYAAPVSAAAVDFNGPQQLHVREDIADYRGTADGYINAVRTKIACTSYAVDGQTSAAPVRVVPISPAVVTAGVDTRSGATAFGVKTVDAQGRASYHVWLRQGDLVISVQDDALTANQVSAVQLAQLALERVRNTIA